ncbi:MAG: hypothetical protein R3D58_07095 [Saprospiraceae bacterium]|nr:hypothetical protein [Lewinellaceae bacterium]
MKLREIVLTALVVVAIIVAALALFLKRTDTQGETPNEQNTDDKRDKMGTGPMPCQKVPANLPKYKTALTSPGAKDYLKVPDEEWTADFEARLRGFFVAVDVEPSDFTLKYFGADLIWKYLDSQDGQLPDLLVIQSSKRCDTIVSIPAGNIPKPPFCLSFTSGNWLQPTYKDGKDAPSDEVRATFGISKADWTPAMISRVKGFFKAVNIEPSKTNAIGLSGWYGRKPAIEYLNSALGGLPDTLITKGIMRCDGKSSQFINDL